MLDDQSINHLFNKSLLTAQYNPSTLPVLCLKPFPGKQTNEHQQQKTLGKKGESMFYWGWKGKKKENVPLWQFQYCNMDHLPLQDAQTLLDPYGVLKRSGYQALSSDVPLRVEEWEGENKRKLGNQTNRKSLLWFYQPTKSNQSCLKN